ncbi:MAG: hypothetical protein ABJB47_20045 [Actinomycetota bacterium]
MTRLLDGRHHLERFAMEQAGEVDYLITWRDNEFVGRVSLTPCHRAGANRRCFAFPKSPDASQFASEVGSFGLSVQLWSPDKVVVLGISTCTTVSCSIGGSPAPDEPYNAAMAVLDQATGGTLHADTDSPAMAPGDSVTLIASYDRATGIDNFSVTDNTANTSFTDTYVDPAATYQQARVGAEFSIDPFHTAPYSAPSDPVRLVKFSGIRVTDYSGQRAGFSSAHWDRAKVIWTRNGKNTGAIDGQPRNLFSTGTAFNVFLHP